jgi:ribosome-interacting GTPase 1
MVVDIPRNLRPKSKASKATATNKNKNKNNIINRLDILESWQGEMNSNTLDAAKKLDEIDTWKKDLITQLTRQITYEITKQFTSPDVRNQDMARLSGLSQTIDGKLDSLSDRVIRIERKYLLPAAKVVINGDTVISDTINAIEHKTDNINKRLVVLEDLDRKTRDEIKTIITTMQSRDIPSPTPPTATRSSS